MKSKILGISIAAAFTALIATGPSFGQSMLGGGGQPPAAAPAAPSGGGMTGGGARNSGPRGGNRAGMVRGGGNRQAWSGRHYRGGYRGGYGGGVFIGTAPLWGAPAYAYDDDYDVDAPVAVGGDAAYCMRRFKSYDPRSGTYLGFDGARHPCP